MVNLIIIEGGHKVVCQVLNREIFLAKRNSVSNLLNVKAAREGDAEAKSRLVQMAYNDLMPDGKVAGCCHPSDCFFHDIDCYDPAQAEAVKEKILSLKSEIGLLMLERSAGGGWHLVCRRELGKTILENQVRIAKILQMEMDTNCHDLSRVVYSTTGSPDDLVYLDDAIFESTLSVEESEREYQLLKERARKGLEEVGKGAKSDNKHYRPWEDEAKAVKSEVVESEESPTTFPDNYHGHPFSEIISKYWELNNHGYEPTIGDRDTKTYQLARDLQHICGRNFNWLDQVIPCYDGFPVEEKRPTEPVEPTLESSGFYFNAANPPAFPSDRKLPQLIRLLTSRTPGIYKAAVADAVFPSLGTHLYDTWFKYTDNVKHEATLMNCLVAESGTGKGCIDEPINHIMAEGQAQPT